MTSWHRFPLSGHLLLRRWRVLAVGILAAVLAAVTLWSLSASVDASATLRIQNGMTEAEVVSLFGGATGSSRCPIDLPPHFENFSSGERKYWKADAGVIYIDFDARGRVGGAGFYSWDAAAPSLLTQVLRQVRRALGL
jgi:hypothetical protein